MVGLLLAELVNESVIHHEQVQEALVLTLAAVFCSLVSWCGELGSGSVVIFLSVEIILANPFCPTCWFLKAFTKVLQVGIPVF